MARRPAERRQSRRAAVAKPVGVSAGGHEPAGLRQPALHARGVAARDGLAWLRGGLGAAADRATRRDPRPPPCLAGGRGQSRPRRAFGGLGDRAWAYPVLDRWRFRALPGPAPAEQLAAQRARHQPLARRPSRQERRRRCSGARRHARRAAAARCAAGHQRRHAPRRRRCRDRRRPASARPPSRPGPARGPRFPVRRGRRRQKAASFRAVLRQRRAAPLRLPEAGDVTRG